MTLDEVRTQIVTLKLYLSRIDDWATQASNMIHDIENKIIDIEEQHSYQKYLLKDSIQNLKEAATKECSPKQNQDRCAKESSNLTALIQEFSYINNLISKRS
jgi:septal ring factor EnvC (AmiA/AmiB activator)